MLHLIPRPLYRVALRMAHGLRKVWWRLARPHVTGVRVIALDGADRVLLIRHSYGSNRWMPPGGGVGRGEDVLAAAARELAEECGCNLTNPVEIAQVTENLHGAVNRVHVVAGRMEGTPEADGREVVEVGCYSADDLPDAMPEMFRQALPEWLELARAL